jgi:histidinol-phosphate aminotransferase
VAEQDFALSPERLLDALEPDTKLVFVCSPNNPSGGVVPAPELLRLADALQGRAMLVVDEAYIEFADGPSLAGEAARRPNLALLRTLSKATRWPAPAWAC